jgi:hypothetical protein
MASARFEIYFVRRRTEDEAVPAGATWRLLSNNNRDLGRAITVFPSIDSCAAAVELLRRAVAQVVAISSRDGRANWTWQLQLDRVPIAVSSRTYQRRVQAEYACTVFRGLAGTAEVINAVRFVRICG